MKSPLLKIELVKLTDFLKKTIKKQVLIYLWVSYICVCGCVYYFGVLDLATSFLVMSRS